MADMVLFAKMITEAGLMNKPFSAMSTEEVQTVFTACYSAGVRQNKAIIFNNPYINKRGVLIIPFDSDPKYHYWKSYGQRIVDTLRELGASEEVFRNYIDANSYTGIDDVPF